MRECETETLCRNCCEGDPALVNNDDLQNKF